VSKVSWVVSVMVTAAGTGMLSAASFDCAKATTAIEKLICSNPALSKADEVMAAAYKKATLAAANLPAAEQDDLKQDQLAWLKNRVAECSGNPEVFGDPAPRGARCIAEQYKRRTAALQVYATQAALDPSQPVNPTGTFDEFGICVSCGEGRLKFDLHRHDKVAFSVEVNNGKNLGDTSGEFTLEDHVAVYTDDESDCSLTFRFTHATVKVEQKGDCDFGVGVRADGFYLKTSNAVPKISDQ